MKFAATLLVNRCPCALAGPDLVTGSRTGRERHLSLAPLPIKRIHDRWIGDYARGGRSAQRARLLSADTHRGHAGDRDDADRAHNCREGSELGFFPAQTQKLGLAQPPNLGLEIKGYHCLFI